MSLKPSLLHAAPVSHVTGVPPPFNTLIYHQFPPSPTQITFVERIFDNCKHKYINLVFRSVCKIAKKRLLASLYLSVCPFVFPSVSPHGTTPFSRDGLLLNLVFEYFSKCLQVFQVSLKSDKNNGYLT